MANGAAETPGCQPDQSLKRAAGLTTSTSSTRTALTPTRRSRRRWARWITWCGRARPSMREVSNYPARSTMKRFASRRGSAGSPSSSTSTPTTAEPRDGGRTCSTTPSATVRRDLLLAAGAGVADGQVPQRRCPPTPRAAASGGTMPDGGATSRPRLSERLGRLNELAAGVARRWRKWPSPGCCETRASPRP